MSPERVRISALLFLLIGYSAAQSPGAEPTALLIKPGSNNMRPAYVDFMLTCVGNDDRTELFSGLTWFGPQGEIRETKGKFTVTSDRSNSIQLTFEKPAPEDSGTYRCTGTFDHTRELNAETTVTFYREITWESCPSNQSIVINKPGKVECSMSTNPGTSTSWSKDGRPIQSDHKYVITNSGIRIANVEESDSGRYTIRASVEDTGSIQQRHILVQVQVPPNIIEISPKVESTEGEETVLECRARGHPDPTYRWLDEKGRDLSQEDGFLVDSHRGSLTIKKTRREDEGIYICWAENGAGKVSMEVELIVMVRPEINQLNNITVEEHSSATLECYATGNPAPHLSFRKEGLAAFTEGHPRVIVRQEDKEGGLSVLTLTIPDVVKTDDGLYYCSAENNAGLVDRAGHIAVEYKPELSSPQLVVKTWTDHEVNLTCLARAMPNATVAWMFGRETLDSTRDLYTVIPTRMGSTLRVTPRKEYTDAHLVYGTYTCMAKNRLGESTLNITLEEAGLPGPLVQVNHEASATSVTFTFRGPSSDGGMPIRAYLVRYRHSEGPQEPFKTKEWSAGVTPYILEDLSPRMTYKMWFAAKNDVGAGPWGQEISVATQAESAPEAPRILAREGAVGNSPHQFDLAWTKPEPNGREIDFFELRYFEVVPDGQGSWRGVGSDTIIKVTEFTAGPRYLIADLLPDRYYKVEVRAHNDIGFSQDATIVFKTAQVSTGSQTTEQGGLVAPNIFPTQAIIAVSIFFILIVLIVIDGICYVKCHCGLLWSIVSSLCEGGTHTKQTSAETGSMHNAKQEEVTPMLQEGNGNPTKPPHSLPPPKSAAPRDSAV